jgi:holo-[acyl-carrier protein] synthase
MITGIGIDMIEVERIAGKIGKEQGFRELVFSVNEINYCETATNKYEHYAARFAAKEAFFKAMGTGWTEGTAFNEIEITPDENGKPLLILTGITAVSMQQKGIGNISVSLSHVKAMAMAVVIIESVRLP